MALVEFHQILLSSLGDEKSPKLIPLPVLPGPSLALSSLRRHFPHAAALHYWLDPSTLVTLPKVRKGEQRQCSGEVTFSSEGDFFILPFLDPSVNFVVTDVDDCSEKENTRLNSRVALLEDLVAEQRDFFTSIHSLLSEAVGISPQSFSVNAETAVDQLECWSSPNNQEVCADCGGEPKSNLDPESKAFFPSRSAIANECDQLFEVFPLNPNCKTFEPITTSYSLGNELQAVTLIEEGSEIENNEVNVSGGLYKVSSFLNPDCEPFDPSAMSPGHSIGVASKVFANIKEKEEDENNNNRDECVESHGDTSAPGKGDEDHKTEVKTDNSTVKEDLVEYQMCKSIRPKIILKIHGNRRS